MRYAISRAGVIEQIVTQEDDIAAHLASLGEGYVADAVDDAVGLATHWRAPGGVEARPTHPAPTLSGTVGAPVAGFPAGWTARVLIGGVLAAEAAIPETGEIVFGDAGVWRVEVPEDRARGPQLPAAWSVTVT